MKTSFAIVGAMVVILSVFGSFGVGHFHLYYGPTKLQCTEVK